MAQTNINPKEVLERAKLMMSYDTSKTLTENTESVKTINEDAQQLNEIAPLLLWGLIAAGTATAGYGGYRAMRSPFGSESAEKQIRSISSLCDAAVPKQYQYLASVINKPSLSPQVHAKIASDVGEASEGMGTDEDLIYSAIDVILNKGTLGDWCATRVEYDPSNPKSFEELIIDELDGVEQQKIAGKLKQIIAKSRKKITTKDDTTQEPNFWIDKFPCLRLTNSFPNGWESDIKQDRFGFTSVPVKLKNKGVLTSYRLQQDGKLLQSNGMYTGYKIECGDGKKINTIAESVSNKKVIKEQGDIDINPIGGGGGGGTPTPRPTPRPRPTSQFKNCEAVEFQTYGCRSTHISRVQACLGFTGKDVDGKWGNNTNNKLKDLGFASGFDKDDVELVCSKAEAAGLSSGLSGSGNVKTFGNSVRGKEGPENVGDENKGGSSDSMD